MADAPKSREPDRKLDRKPDWEKAKALYRAGQHSIREIARQCGCSDEGIRKRAKRDGWQHDLADKVKQAVKEKLLREDAAVGSAINRVGNANSQPKPPTDDQTIEDAAAAGAAVVRVHRADVDAARRICVTLFSQLQDAAVNRGEFEQMAQDIAASESDKPAEQARALARFQKAISLPTHAATIRDLSTALKNFQALERIAWNLNDKMPAESNDLVSALRTLNGHEQP